MGGIGYFEGGEFFIIGGVEVVSEWIFVGDV